MKEEQRRRFVAELLGTFAIVFFGCGAIATTQHQATAHLTVNAVFGLTVAASIYALGHISAAHFNPAVTIGFAVVKRFSWREVGPRVVAQLLGAFMASGMHLILIGSEAKSVSFGSTIPTTSIGVALSIEVLLTFFLMLIIISVATDKRVSPGVPGLAIGMTVTLCGLFGGSLSGCSMNPARSLAPAFLAMGQPLNVVWIYIVGPILGAVAASRVYEWLKGDEPMSTVDK